MRLVRYIDGEDGRSVDLHPLMTVISGFDDAERDRLLSAISALPLGNDPKASGQIEVHGICLDLNQESLELLELDHDLDVVLRAGDLPGSEPDEPEPSSSAAPPGPPTWTAADPSPSAEPDAPDPVAEALVAVEAAEVHLESVRTPVEALRDELGRLAQERLELHRATETARRSLDGYAEAGLRVAQEDLAALLATDLASAELAAAQLNAPDVAAARSEVESQLESLIEEASRIKRELKRLRRIHTAAVRDAHQALELAARAGEEPVPAAIELAGRLEASSQRMATVSTRRAGGRQQLHSLTERRDQAYDALVRATRNLRAPELDVQLVDQLETVHDEIFELDGRAGRLGVGKARRRLADLRAKESALLEQLGFNTWSSYVMGVSTNEADAERHRRYEIAKATYELSEEELARAAEVPLLDDPELVEIEREHAQLLDEARALVGGDPGPDPIAYLRALRQSSDASQLSLPDAAAALQLALVEAGATLPARSLAPNELFDIASSWLTEMGGTDEQIASLTIDRDRIEAEISSAADELRALNEIPDPVPPPSVEPEQLNHARATVADCERRVRRHLAAEAELVELAGRVSSIEDREAGLRHALDDREAELASAIEALDGARVAVEAARLRPVPPPLPPIPPAPPSPPASSTHHGASAHSASRRRSVLDAGSAIADAVEWYVLARLAQQRAVSFVGSVPLIIDNAFDRWSVDEMAEVYGRLARMSEVIQMIYLTDDPEVVAWARDLGADRAAVIDARAPAIA